MYLFFDKTGKVNLIHYMELDGVDYNQDNCLFYDGEIPKKEGMKTVTFVDDGNVTFKFEEVPLSEEEVLLKKIKDQEKQLSVLSDTLDFLIMEGVDIND